MSVSNEGVGTNTPSFVTATLPATVIPQPTETPLPPTPSPTVPPIEGLTNTQINVREQPSTSSMVLGVIPVSTKVQVTGKDASGTWYQVIFAESTKGKGWVLAAYVRVTAAVEIPVVQMGSGSGPNASGLVIQQLNVRSGPGTEFDSLGTLNPNDVVVLTGKESSGAWFQIEYAIATDGRGWINASFVQVSGPDTLPIIGGTEISTGTETPAEIQPTPAATTAPAFQDEDSPSAPSIAVEFSPSGVRSLQFSGEVSAPLGDVEDWIQFKPFGNKVEISLACSGSNELRAEVLENNEVKPELGPACNETIILFVQSGKVYLLHLVATSEGSQMTTRYDLKVGQKPSAVLGIAKPRK